MSRIGILTNWQEATIKLRAFIYWTPVIWAVALEGVITNLQRLQRVSYGKPASYRQLQWSLQLAHYFYFLFLRIPSTASGVAALGVILRCVKFFLASPPGKLNGLLTTKALEVLKAYHRRENLMELLSKTWCGYSVQYRLRSTEPSHLPHNDCMGEDLIAFFKPFIRMMWLDQR